MSSTTPQITGKSNDDLRQTVVSKWMKELTETKVDRTEMNKLVMNYLVTEGYKDAAEKFRIESGIEPQQSLDCLDNRIRVREAIQAGEIDKAIDMTNTLNPDILDCNPKLFFHLQQQKLIELIRNGHINDALAFSQSVLADLGTQNDEFLEGLEKAMALLVYEEPELSPFSDLLNLSQRQMVASELNAAILQNKHEETTPKLAGAIKLLLWSQNELDKKQAKYPKMTDIANGTIKTSSESKTTCSVTVT